MLHVYDCTSNSSSQQMRGGCERILIFKAQQIMHDVYVYNDEAECHV